MGRLLASLCLIAIGLAACGTPTPYAPAPQNGGFGHAVQKLEDARFRVTFAGNALTDRHTVENYLLYRAAELTLERGGDYFVVVTRAIEADTDYRTSHDSPPYVGPYRSWRSGFSDPYRGHGTARAITRYDAHAEIIVRSGRKPPDAPAAFDARAMIRNLGPAIVRAAPPG